jgi:hypothetical protein
MGEQLSVNNNNQFAGRTSPQTQPSQFDSRFVAGESFESRFKMTELLSDTGKLRYGLWEPPDVTIRGSEVIYTVTPEFEHRPELVSKKFYDTTSFWWAIMNVNSILLPIRDMVAGIALVIPDLSEIIEALERTRK